MAPLAPSPVRHSSPGLSDFQPPAPQSGRLDAFSASAARAARSDCPILLSGETGVGKGFLAAWIHANSRRASAPLIAVNCGAVPDSIIDSHLFGHARGAFSGAERDHPGLVRSADGGTLFLDEIADLPLPAQSRLLRVLEEREVQPVGVARPVSVNIRVLAATNADLWHAVETRRFRKDLYFRLDVIAIEVPPLRRRLAELDALIAAFNSEFAHLYQQEQLLFSDDARALLHQHVWPGNIRELRSLLERLHVLVGPGVIISPMHLRSHLSLRLDSTQAPSASAPFRSSLKSRAALDALQKHNGDVRTAALTLGVHRSTLYRWLASSR